MGPSTSATGQLEPEAFVISTEVAIILAVVAVAIIGVVAFMVLRKRK